MPQDEPPAPERRPEELRYDGKHWLLAGHEEPAARKAAPGLVPALENAIAIIQMLNRRGQQSASLAELTAELGISKTHCHSLLKTLVYFDWLQFDDRAKTYRLFSGVLPSLSSLFTSPMLDTLRPLLKRLVDKLDVPCVLTQPQLDGTFVLIDKFNGSRSMEVSFPVGHSYPPDSAAQMRAFLAWQPEARLEAWLARWRPVRYTDTTLLTADLIRAEIAATRSRGYSRSDGEFTPGLMAIALPIFDRDGNVAYVVTCTDLTSSLKPREAEVSVEMIRAAATIHERILGRFVPDHARTGS